MAQPTLFERIASPYPAASIAALALVNAVSSLVEPGPLSVRYAVFLAGLVLGLGTLHGLAWQLAFSSLRRLRRALALGLWTLIGLAAAGLLAQRLNAFGLLGGPYRTLAWVVLGSCAAGALALTALLSSMQPHAPGRLGWLRERSFRTRALIAVGLAFCASALLAIDHRYYPDQYQIAHTALRLCALWLLMFGLVLCDDVLKLPRLSARGAFAIALAAALPLVRLDVRQQGALQAFAARGWPSLLLGLSRTLVDTDMDGEATLLAGGDCAPFDARVHPSAREIPDNGIDDNCMLGDAKRRSKHVEDLPVPTAPSPVDVVLITIDALRPDHLAPYNPAYGPTGRYAAPNLDHFAKRASVFERAYSAGGWTSISVPTLMRGMYARRLRWTRYYETNFFAIVRKPFESTLRSGERVERSFLFAYQDPHPPLSEQLRRRGMYTAAVVDDGVSEILRPGLGVERGFTLFYNMDSSPAPARDDAGTTNVALATLRQIPAGQRFFMWVHYFGVHAPDQFHSGVPSYGPTMVDRYDQELVYLDRHVGRLLRALEQRKDLAVFVTADHGENITPTSRLHGQTLDEDVVRVPLIARVPGWPVGRVPAVVSLVDLAPTILQLTGTPAPKHLDGEDLAGPAKGGAVRPRILLSDTWRYSVADQLEIDQVAALDGRRKVILDRAQQHVGSYDITHPNPTPEPPVPPKPVDPFGDPLSLAIYGYLEETGSALETAD